MILYNRKMDFFLILFLLAMILSFFILGRFNAFYILSIAPLCSFLYWLAEFYLPRKSLKSKSEIEKLLFQKYNSIEKINDDLFSVNLYNRKILI